MGRQLSFALALALLCANVPAQAQRLGSLIGRESRPTDSMTIFRMFASCVYDRQEKKVIALLGTIPGSAEEAQAFDRMNPDMPVCLESDRLISDGKALRMNRGLLRRGLAEVAVARVIARLPVSRPATSEDPWFVEPLKAMPVDARRNQEALGSLNFGHCVAYGNWSQTIALLATAPGSADEAAATGALRPALGPCISAGMTVKLDRSTLRSSLAESVWHIAQPAPPVPDTRSIIARVAK